ncbi:hypothetical protein [Mucisphaera sp.]|uniref:hypothetical protein n=1 Tax=Mucisphaera sp. TaxID=2913024 RepID=UPI003D138205
MPISQLHLLSVWLCLITGLSATHANTPAEAPLPLPGRTLWLNLDSAPYPHASRQAGYTRNNILYPAEDHYEDNTVLIYIPASVSISDTIDVLVYFHGHRNHVRKAVDEFRIREQLEASGRPLVLVFPQGPYNAPDSGCGKLADQNGLRDLLDEVRQSISTQDQAAPALGKVVLSGHSGAFRAIGRCLAFGGVREHIDEVHLLDASYGEWDTFIDWAAEDPEEHRLFSIFTNHLAAANVGMITAMQAQELDYKLLGDEHETLPDRPWPTRVFVHSRLSNHNETVSWLERSLRARGIE